MSLDPVYKVPEPERVDDMDERRKTGEQDPRRGEELVFTVIDPKFPGWLGHPLRPGAEFRVVVGSVQWALTLDGDGNSWLDMDREAQRQRFGAVVFKSGPRGDFKPPPDEFEQRKVNRVRERSPQEEALHAIWAEEDEIAAQARTDTSRTTKVYKREVLG